MTIEQLIEESKGNVKILDLIKYPELHDLEVKPVEKVCEPWECSLTEETLPVWQWIKEIYQLANMCGNENIEQIYRELMSVNFEEA